MFLRNKKNAKKSLKRHDLITSVVYGVRSYNGKEVCEKCFQAKPQTVRYLHERCEDCHKRIPDDGIEVCEGHSRCPYNHGDYNKDLGACSVCH